TVTASDPAGHMARQTFTVTVRGSDRAPTIISSPVTTVATGLTYRYDLQASDPDADPLSFRIDAGPAGMTLDALGRVTGSPGSADVGPHDVTLVAADTGGLSATQSYDLMVAADTEPPRVLVLVSANPVDLGSAETFLVFATDNVGVQALGLT